MRKSFLSVAIAFSSLGFSQVYTDTTKAPANWFNLDPYTNKVNGVSTERTYNELLKGKKSTTVIVGVIDSGVDFNHEDLKDIMWTNPKEIPNNGIDDDKNGYIDDIHGWNFLGGKDGKNVEHETIELTRLYRDLNKMYSGVEEKAIASSDVKEYRKYLDIKSNYEKKLDEAQKQLTQINFVNEMFVNLNLEIKDQLDVDSVKAPQLKQFKAKDKKQEGLLAYAQLILSQDTNLTVDYLLKQLDEAQDHFESQVKYNYNLDYDPRGIVGDDYKNSYEKYYGNNDCKGPGSLHGTHVAGIIAANRVNNIGVKGVGR